ncbi:MAG: hypothetical protein WAW90_00365, partial [Minisyncoccia bacterium]
SVACSLTPDETVEIQKELLQPNSSLSFGIDSVEGYENFMPARISNALGYIGSESTAVANPLFLERIPLEQKLQKILSRKNVLKAMNVKYVTSGIPITDSDLSLVKSLQVGHCKNAVYLYELHGVWPRYFVTNNVAQATSTSDYGVVFDELNLHQTPVVLFNSSVSIEKSPAKTFVTEAIPTLGERDMRFDHVTCTASCAFFVGNTFLDGWRAMVDGNPAPIYRVNYTYMALVLEPGEHTIVLTYQ